MAYLKALTDLRKNVKAELDIIRRVGQRELVEDCRCDACLACGRLLEQLDADIRGVSADVEQLIEGGQF